jgi:hypothetical protein
MKMKQCPTLLFLLGFATPMLQPDAVAQPASGAVSGAIIGGAVVGRLELLPGPPAASPLA